MGHVGTLGYSPNRFWPAAHPHHIGDIVGAVIHPQSFQRIEHRPLRTLCVFQQGAVDELAFFQLCGQAGSRAEVRLLCQEDQELGLALGGSLQHPAIHFGLPGGCHGCRGGCEIAQQ